MVSKDDAIKILADVPANQVFFLVTGAHIRNIHELEDALNHMADDTFSYHVNSEKNDFYEWIKGVLEDKEVLPAVKKANTREKLAKVIGKRIEKLDKLSHQKIIAKHEKQQRLIQEIKNVVKKKKEQRVEKAKKAKLEKPKKEKPKEIKEKKKIVKELPVFEEEKPVKKHKTHKINPVALPVEIIKETPKKFENGFDLNIFFLGILLGMLIGLIVGKLI